MPKVPSGILIVSVGHFIAGALVLAGAAWIGMASATVLGSAARFADPLIALLVGFGATYWLAGWGVWQLHDWARALAIALGAAVLFGLLAAAIAIPSPLSALPGYVLLTGCLEAALVYYLVQPVVARCFARGASISRISDQTRTPSRLDTALGWLVISSGPLRGRRYDVRAGRHIGRAPACDIQLDDDDRVAARHARLGVENGQVFVYDLGSRGGTWVNDRPVQRHLLYDGALLRVGHTTFEFKKAIASTR
ncbi:MAG TPA: FHA domain-containing protein [Chloroflexota bacterium]